MSSGFFQSVSKRLYPQVSLRVCGVSQSSSIPPAGMPLSFMFW
jgi:hypothetical protein